METFLEAALAGKSPAISGFWYGKFLQELEREHRKITGVSIAGSHHSEFLSTLVLGKTLHQHVQDATAALNTHQSYLSPSVHVLVTSLPSQQHDIPSCVESDDMMIPCLLSWESVGVILSQAAEYCSGECSSISSYIVSRCNIL